MTAHPRTTRTTRTLGSRAAALVAVAVLAGCAKGPAAEDPSPSDSTSPLVASTAPTPEAAESLTDAAALRTTGSALTVGAVTVWLTRTTAAAVPTATSDEDGATTFSLDLTDPQDALLIAPPEGTTPVALADGTVVLHDGAGTAVAGLTSAGVNDTAAAEVEVQADGLMVYRSPTAPVSITITLATTALRSATWADRGDEGGLSLAVVPTDWARTGGAAADELLWAQVVAAEPEADGQNMHDQLTCHLMGAPEKASWNLEPWRPDVGLTSTLLAACNP